MELFLVVVPSGVVPGVVIHAIRVVPGVVVPSGVVPGAIRVVFLA